jgi:hypothetical protein
MATSSTLPLPYPGISAERAAESHDSRLRRLFRRRARRRRGVHSGWREEATLRALTRMGA